MMKLFFALCCLLFAVCSTNAASRIGLDNFVSPANYKAMYPAMDNSMRVALNPGTTPNTGNDPVRALVRTTDASGTNRRVVARNAARATTPMTSSPTALRAATIPTTNNQRRVVARNNPRSVITPTTGRNTNTVINDTTSTTTPISSVRCLADYTQCMNGYCERENTDYNRCYCSPKLAQIDAQYQPAINDLIQQIVILQNGKSIYTQQEMDEYWHSVIGVYTGDNSWANLDTALDIDWSDTESRIRGQTAFNTGHEYCAQHLKACSYMGSNLRDAYRSEIARDCAVYETTLGRIQDAAESLIEAYDD